MQLEKWFLLESERRHSLYVFIQPSPPFILGDFLCARRGETCATIRDEGIFARRGHVCQVRARMPVEDTYAS